jgi:hypothetical protein
MLAGEKEVKKKEEAVLLFHKTRVKKRIVFT